MAEEYDQLKKFMHNFLENERFLPDELELLDPQEIKDISGDETLIKTDRQLADRLLNDPEALEMLHDLKEEKSGGSGKILKIPISKKNIKAKGFLKPVGRETLKKAAASSRLPDNTTGNAFQVQDDKVKGFVQISEYRDDQFIVSGHLSLASSFRYLKLMLPGGTNINEYRVEDDKLIFKEIVTEWIDITEIQYELY